MNAQQLTHVGTTAGVLTLPDHPDTPDLNRVHWDVPRTFGYYGFRVWGMVEHFSPSHIELGSCSSASVSVSGFVYDRDLSCCTTLKNSFNANFTILHFSQFGVMSPGVTYRCGGNVLTQN